ncbi:MAG: adenylosuccinate lyase [Candidatus Fermentibacteraceae bacterium]|nr:adenylosuccinate lyase [Candidatus Fermentibacteraceae bacterium]
MIERYSIPEMSEIWSTESRYSRWLEIEILAVEARMEAGLVPREDFERIRANASFDPGRVAEIEETVRHDVIAFLTSVSESLGPESRHIHYGMTSSDVLDTCLATQIRDSGSLLMRELMNLGEALKGLAGRTRGVLCMGRSHGMFAEPTTMGLKFAGYYSEFLRVKKRLSAGLESACVGKVSGAVGTYAYLDPSVEEFVCGKLGIGREQVATQVVARDRHADFMYALASVGGMLERLGTEIRHLQRSEVGEVEESFGKGQKGSSAMPHKRNPIVSERLCGLARMLRGYLVPSLEDTALWHERDISHSSAERFLFPDACGIALYMLRKSVDLVEGLRIFPDRAMELVRAAGDRFYSQSLLLALIDRGVSREKAYRIVQDVAMESMERDSGFLEVAGRDPSVTELISEDEMASICTLEYHLRNENSTLDRLGLVDDLK